MVRFQVIAVGKAKEPFYRDGGCRVLPATDRYGGIYRNRGGG
ncbi:hypothetical protein [Methanogenium cariaci]|nr:hypothetical protein [Methanogenium cariaci]